MMNARAKMMRTFEPPHRRLRLAAIQLIQARGRQAITASADSV